MLEKKSALIKTLFFYGEMSVMNNEVFNKLVEEYGFELRKDPIEDGPIACYHGRIVMYLLTSNLIDVLDEYGNYYSTDSESDCREWLNEVLKFLKQQELERKIRKMDKDFE